MLKRRIADEYRYLLDSDIYFLKLSTIKAVTDSVKRK